MLEICSILLKLGAKISLKDLFDVASRRNTAILSGADYRAEHTKVSAPEGFTCLLLSAAEQIDVEFSLLLSPNRS